MCNKLLRSMRPRKCSGALHAKLCPELHDLSKPWEVRKVVPFRRFSDQGPPFRIALDNPVEIAELVLARTGGERNKNLRNDRAMHAMHALAQMMHFPDE